jgi:hypothetical protein
MNMGVWVGYNDRMIWSPGLMAGHLFIDEMSAIAKTIGQESGIVVTMSDTVEIDPPAFASFIQAVLRTLEETSNGPLFAMSAGCIEVAIALNAKLTGEWPTVSARLQPLVDQARTVLDPISPSATPPLP